MIRSAFNPAELKNRQKGEYILDGEFYLLESEFLTEAACFCFFTRNMNLSSIRF